MEAIRYELTDSLAGFEEGDILDVTARFGDWHTHQLKLEPKPSALTTPTVAVTASEAGFSEAEILDPTARFGDWHQHDLKFDPVESPEEETDANRITLTADEFEAITEPVDARA